MSDNRIMVAFPEDNHFECMKMIQWLFVNCHEKPKVMSHGYLNDGEYMYEVTIPDRDDRLLFSLAWSEYIRETA